MPVCYLFPNSKFVVSFYFANSNFIGLIPSLSAFLLSEKMFCILFPILYVFQTFPIRNRYSQAFPYTFVSLVTMLFLSKLYHRLGGFAIAIGAFRPKGGKNQTV